MKLQYVSSTFLQRLRDTAAVNVAKYGTGTDWLNELANGKSAVLESDRVVDPLPNLILSAGDNASNDAENAKRVYTWLKALPPVVAMEERLWAYLTHFAFPDYMKARWPADNENTVLRRYLFEGKSFAALTRNGLARLWWAGFLTYDETRSNHFELTDTLFLRQDIHVSLLERSLGKCRNVRFSVLDFLRENQEWLAAEAFGKRIQLLLKELNLAGGVAILDALPAEDLKVFLQRAAEDLTKNNQETAAA